LKCFGLAVADKTIHKLEIPCYAVSLGQHSSGQELGKNFGRLSVAISSKVFARGP
jgi:hypothetical protein